VEEVIVEEEEKDREEDWNLEDDFYYMNN